MELDTLCVGHWPDDYHTTLRMHSMTMDYNRVHTIVTGSTLIELDANNYQPKATVAMNTIH